MLRRRLEISLILLCAVLAVAGCGSSSAEKDSKQEQARTTVIAGARNEFDVPPLPEKGLPPKHLIVEDLRRGWGVEARKGDLLTTKFVSVMMNGRPFESTWEPGNRPFSFHLGKDESSPGWERGMEGMRVGGRRELIIPGKIVSRYVPLTPEDSIAYVIELVGVKPPELDERREPDVSVPPGAPPKQLKVRDLIEGQGPAAEAGDTVTMNYVSRRYSGEPFSNSWDDGHPFRIRLGADTYKSIPGWEEGLPGMRVGGRREIIVPPDWIYQGGAPPDSKPSETLVYIVDLIGITDPRERAAGSA